MASHKLVESWSDKTQHPSEAGQLQRLLTKRWCSAKMRGVLVLLLLQGANLLFGEKHPATDINNRLCIFPFKYDGFEFNQCTTHKTVNGKAWCASEVDHDGIAQCYQKENCDDCSSSYPRVEPPSSISTDINNRLCIFPFKYDGFEFNQCTTHKSVNGKAWCASEVDDYANAQCHQKENCDDCSFPRPPAHCLLTPCLLALLLLLLLLLALRLLAPRLLAPSQSSHNFANQFGKIEIAID